jgi:hypothetical protein
MRLTRDFADEVDTSWYALDQLRPSEKRKVTGSTPVPTTTDE